MNIKKFMKKKMYLEQPLSYRFDPLPWVSIFAFSVAYSFLCFVNLGALEGEQNGLGTATPRTASCTAKRNSATSAPPMAAPPK